jgi:CarD family transcriptional regulator
MKMQEREMMEAASALEGEQMKLEIGEKVIYPGHGVAVVDDIREVVVNNQPQMFYYLKIVDTNRKVLVPFGNLETVHVRRPLSPEQLKEVMEIIGEPARMEAEPKAWQRRYRELADKLKTGSIYETAEVYRDLGRLRLRHGKTLSFGEKRMLHQASNLLSKEVSLVMGKTEEEVLALLEGLI